MKMNFILICCCLNVFWICNLRLLDCLSLTEHTWNLELTATKMYLLIHSQKWHMFNLERLLVLFCVFLLFEWLLYSKWACGLQCRRCSSNCYFGGAVCWFNSVSCFDPNRISGKSSFSKNGDDSSVGDCSKSKDQVGDWATSTIHGAVDAL